jgi:hypothetical protein
MLREKCAFLGHYAASNPETSVMHYHYSLSNGPERRSSHPLRSGSLKSCILRDITHSKCAVVHVSDHNAASGHRSNGGKAPYTLYVDKG